MNWPTRVALLVGASSLLLGLNIAQRSCSGGEYTRGRTDDSGGKEGKKRSRHARDGSRRDRRDGGAAETAPPSEPGFLARLTGGGSDQSESDDDDRPEASGPAKAAVAADEIRGRVLDRDGRAVASARVWIRKDGATGLTPPDDASTADGSGVFHLRAVPSGRLTLAANAEGFAGGEASARGGDGDVEISLESAPMLRGQVLDASTSQPLARYRLGSRTITADDGRFEIPDLTVAAGGRALIVSAEGYVSATLTPAELESARVGRGVEVRLQAGLAVRGQVTSAERRDGLPRATVELTPHGGGESRSAQTDSEGRFSLPGLAAGTYDVLARAPGYADRALSATVRDGSDELAIELGRGATLKGKLLDGKAWPASGRRVTLVRVGASGPLGTAAGPSTVSGRTDAEGHFELQHVPAGDVRLLILADADRRTEVRKLRSSGDGEASAGELHETPPGTSELSVTIAAGDDGPRGRVQVYVLSGALAARAGADPNSDWLDDFEGALWEQSTEPGGTAKFDALPEGSLAVFASAGSGASLWSGVGSASVEPARPGSVTVTLEPVSTR